MRIRHALIATLGAIAATLSLAPAATAGTAVSSVPNLPSGARAGGTVQVPESGLTGSLSITQIFNGADIQAIAQLRQIRLSLNCGPGPSAGNPSANGPAINNPETPCTNPDPGVFGSLSPTATGSQACAGTTFSFIGPDAQGQVDLIPNFPVYLTNAQTCEISFTFSVLDVPTKDTFPNAAGMQTTSVSSVRSEIVSDPGNPAAIGLQAAGLGSGDAVLIEPPNCTTNPNLAGCTSDCTTNPSLAGCLTNCTTNPNLAGCTPDCTTNPKATGCSGVKSNAGAAAAKPASLAAACVGKRIRASVSGDGIARVTYELDGRKLAVVKGGSPNKLNVAARALRAGGKLRLSAVVDFKAKSAQDLILARRLARCRAPNFTG